jgi:rare lipoprotein A
MSAIERAGVRFAESGTNNRSHHAPAAASAGGAGALLRFFAIVLAAASLAACARSSVVSSRSDFIAPTRHAAVDHSRPTWFAMREHAVATPKHALAPETSPGETHVASRGVASFYSEGARTANGEKFDPNELTAAHPTLPFGTHLRVTNMSTGRSVTVRVNDRGPFKKGRVVDVSYSAAKQLGMVHAGVANVKMDVVQ